MEGDEAGDVEKVGEMEKIDEFDGESAENNDELWHRGPTDKVGEE
jgi:hypothetical protein